MSRISDLPIRRKLTLSIMLTSIAALLLSSTAFVAYDVTLFRREMVEKLASLAGVAGNNTVAALEFSDPKSAADTLSSLRAEPNLIAALVFDRSGRVFASYWRDGETDRTVPAVVREAAHEFAQDRLQLFRPVTNRGEPIGTILLVSDLNELSEQMSRDALIIGLVLAFSLLVAIGLSRYFDRLLLRPILRLSALTRAVAEEKNYSVRAPKERNDEFGHLVDGFNHMLSQLQARDAALQEAHALLEARVAERTASLERARAEAAQEHARFKLIFDSVPVGICLTVKQASGPALRLFNRAHAEICGLPPDQAGDPEALRRITHPDDDARERLLVRQMSDGAIEKFSLEKRFQLPDGRTRWVVCSVQRRHDGAEELSTVVDITERKQAELEREQSEAALRVSEDRFSKSFRTHPDSISIVRLSDNALMEINPGFTKLTGYSAEEALGRSPLADGLGIWMIPEDRARLIRTLQRGGETTAVETKLRRRDGAVLICTVTAGLMEVGGEPCLLTITRDLTAHKRLEEQLVRAGKMDAVGQLAGGVAHDYNNILTANMLQIQLLLTSEGLAPETKTALNELKTMSERAAGLTRQLLAFSRQQVIRIQPVELNEVVVQLLRMLSRLLGENIKVSFQGTAQPLWLEADVGMIEQVITNLCINARDAMLPQGGSLTIVTSCVDVTPAMAGLNPEAYPGRFACLAVQDSGCGMDAKTLQHIFEPFFTTKEVGKGTGLGLATTYGITKQHRGWVEVQSEVGRGSTFRVLLPATNSGPAPAPEKARPIMRRGHETILIVEDETFVRKMTRTALQRHGYTVLEAVDGADAIRVWEQHSKEIALVLSDMVMPNGYNGLDLAARFKADQPALQVIIASGYSVNLRETGIPTGQGITYLAKPFDVSALNNQIRKCLDERS